jgi:Uma2 family endonuclease
LGELGFFGENDRVELIRGEIVEMSPKGTPHETCITRLWRRLSKLLGERATLRCQAPIILPHYSEPKLDLAIVQNRPDDYLSAYPSPSDVLLVIEVADSTLKYDREIKIPLYAEAGISNYWIFNLVQTRLEVYTEPYQDLQGNFDYRLTRIVLPNEAVALGCFPDLSLDLSLTFPL